MQLDGKIALVTGADPVDAEYRRRFHRQHLLDDRDGRVQTRRPHCSSRAVSTHIQLGTTSSSQEARGPMITMAPVNLSRPR